MKVNKFAEKFCHSYYRWKMDSDITNFTGMGKSKLDCLVCMPSDMQFMMHAASKLPDIAAIFPNRLIKVLITSNIDPQSYKFIKRFTLIKPYSYDLNVFYLPKRSFLNKLKGKGLSVCVDLDFRHNFFNTVICGLTGAPMRIGSRKGVGLPYYNLEIDVGDGDQPAKVTYEHFIKVLYNFKSEGEKLAPV